jgi:hypothetical protein
MQPDDVTKLRELLAAATPRPWAIDDAGCIGAGGVQIGLAGEADAALIVAAVNALPDGSVMANDEAKLRELLAAERREWFGEPGVTWDEAYSSRARARAELTIAATNALPELLDSLAALAAERDALRARVALLEQALSPFEGHADAISTSGTPYTNRHEVGGFFDGRTGRHVSIYFGDLRRVDAALAAAKPGDDNAAT